MQRLLEKESELYLNYLYGMPFEEFFFLQEQVRFGGIFFRLLIFIRYVLAHIRFKSIGSRPTEILCFAESVNQMASLSSTVEGLEKLGIPYILFYSPKLEQKVKDFKSICQFWITPLDAAAALFLAVRRIFILKDLLQAKGLGASYRNRLDMFLRSYLFLVWADRVLVSCKPRLVIVANDHNVSTRSLRLVSEAKRIATAYMQHASVMHRFPPLEFDYAFLDGDRALEAYIRCDLETERKLRDCTVFLTGEKKGSSELRMRDSSFAFGIGTNQLDDFPVVKKIVDLVTGSGLQCVLRTHPNQQEAFLQRLHQEIRQNPRLSWSNSGLESVSSFFQRINVLVAGDTSLHLEAVLSGLATYYAALSPNPEFFDYYGYVGSGLCRLLPEDFFQYSRDQILRMAKREGRTIEAARSYSATYGTQWENREGDLVADQN